LKPSYKSFAIFAGIVFWILLSLQLFQPQWIKLYSWLLYAYFIAITLLSFYLVDKSITTKDPYEFYNASMGSTTVRLFMSGGILFYYFFNYETDKIPFTATFFAFYCSFTAFEITMLLQKIKK
jgi:hypothetical protein